jgi:hypothetical protein
MGPDELIVMCEPAISVVAEANILGFSVVRC